MTREQAVKQAQKRWGRHAIVSRAPELSSPEKREKAKAEHEALKARRAGIEAEIRRRELEAGIPELRAQIEALSKPRALAMWNAMRYAFEVGCIDGILGAFHI